MDAPVWAEKRTENGINDDKCIDERNTERTSVREKKETERTEVNFTFSMKRTHS